MAKLHKGLIVSCQAVLGEPLYGLNIMQYFAKAAVEGGASGIRANYVDDILQIKKMVDVPVIGIIKAEYDGSEVYITPTLNEVKKLIATNCEVIALDATDRPRPNGEKLSDLVRYIRKNSTAEIMADCSTFEEATAAYKLGFDYIGSTMRGYTSYTKGIEIPDYSFLTKMVKDFPNTKIIAEGGIWEANQLSKVCECGVYAVVIGSAITRPKDITQHFVKALKL